MNHLLENMTDEQFERFWRNWENDHVLSSWSKQRRGLVIDLTNGKTDRYIPERLCIECRRSHPGPQSECPNCGTYLPSLLLETGRPWAFWVRYQHRKLDNGGVIVTRDEIIKSNDKRLYETSNRIAEYMPGAVLAIRFENPNR